MANAFTDRVEEIVCAALEIKTSAERAAYLDANCGNEPELRAAVQAMLSSQAEVESFFRETGSTLTLPPGILAAIAGRSDPHDDADALCCVGDNGERLIGPYKLLQKIGEGGCGSVYMAEQLAPNRRRVALKIIKLGMDTKRVVARFEAERQALALMDHPNIARVLDGGATPSGRPYFVMELVRGLRITTFCDENHLDLRQRLGLFVQVCDAVQHAHQKGIIHRDIKPSNILITSHDGAPMPKVIDFGIAKASDGQVLTDKTLFTAFELFVGTPAYMSPEQAELSNLDVDTRSDIYSMGVLLYELLTGRTPFDQQELVNSGLDEMRRTLREKEPPRPSVRLSLLRVDELTETAVRRRVEARSLRSLLAGDLDWVVMKALEKNRSRRYQTANALGMEVQRYLNSEPVLARPPNGFYRFRKLVQRNRAVFAATGAVSLALIVGFGASSWLFIRERHARQQQVVLREEAERARAEENRLRLEAEDNARMAKAAILVTRGKLAEADELINRTQFPDTRPSMEATRAFSSLGDWNALHGRWGRAANCFLRLHLANQIDSSDLTDHATRDLLRIAPTLVIAGEMASYRRVIRETVARFAKTDHPVAAEHVLKISTIVPADMDILYSLKPLARVAEDSLDGGRWSAKTPEACVTYLDSWRMVAISMYYYRCGNFASSILWGQHSLACDDQTPTRIAMTHAVLAMASHRIDCADGYSELASARAILDAKFPGGDDRFVETGDDFSGYWNDWIIARLLCDEAGRSMKISTSPPN
jgi:serine/threonine protein kinase